MKSIPRNGILLISSLVLVIIVYLRESTWNHLPSTPFWIVAFAIIIATFILGISLAIGIIRFIAGTNRSLKDFVLLTLSFCILLIIIIGMK